MIARLATDDDVREVVVNVCALDAAMLFARRFDDDRAALAEEMIALRRFEIAAYAFAAAAGAPAQSLLGATLIAPGVATLHWFSTGRWAEFSYDRPLLWLDFWRSTFLPEVLIPTVHRAECRILAANRAQARRLARVGFVAEGLERAAGRAGEDFVRFAWLNPQRRPTVDGATAALGWARMREKRHA
ncbi:MAG TPA: hypothetical protein VNK91_06480 [Burkholderiaceae bacterium]|nr:hypothetical protein [Burkholderiaceae bacterium]